MVERNEMEQEKRRGTEGEEIADFSSLPEGVIATILSLTTPSDACRSSAVSWTFHAAAQSDIVWGRFLPSDCDLLISLVKPNDLDFDPISSSKKDIFFSLCDSPLLIDDGKKSFSLDIWSGKKCIMLGARDLSIVWGDTAMYWNWEPHHGSRFAEVAVLLNVWWFEIRGKISCRMLSPATTYAAYFVFKVKKRTYYGFNIDPVYATVGIVGGEECGTKSVCLDPYIDNPHWSQQPVPWVRSNEPVNNMSEFEQPRMRSDGWFEIELGEFQTDGEDDEVKVSLKEVRGSSSKSGIVVQGIEIRPKTGPAWMNS